jgi:alpha-amylase
MNQARNVTATFAAAVAPLTVTSFTADKTGPQPVGTAITFTVTGSGGVAPYQYKWWVWNGSAWSLGRDWGTGNTFTWTPTAAGSYFIHVWVRSNGTVADAAEAYNGLWTTIVP